LVNTTKANTAQKMMGEDVREQGIHGTRLLTLSMTILVIVLLVVITVLAAIYVPQIAIYVPIVALGIALALQKYTASFFSYFVIAFQGIYNIGDRIRIGNIKGDVWKIGLFNTILEEVGEDEKLGGELTGRLLYVPNLIILDQPVLNYSKDYTGYDKPVSSDFIFDEVRIPLATGSNIEKAIALLERIVKREDEVYLKEAGQMFQKGYPRFLDEAMTGSRVLVYIEPTHIWIKGKFVAPLRERNDLKSRILLEFLREINATKDIKLA